MKSNVAYCRVSSAAQKPDMKNQRRVLEEFTAARGLTNVEWVEEVGGGLNFERKRFLEIMDRIGRSEIGFWSLRIKIGLFVLATSGSSIIAKSMNARY